MHSLIARPIPDDLLHRLPEKPSFVNQLLISPNLCDVSFEIKFIGSHREDLVADTWRIFPSHISRFSFGCRLTTKRRVGCCRMSRNADFIRLMFSISVLYGVHFDGYHRSAQRFPRRIKTRMNRRKKREAEGKKSRGRGR